jgi:hypothetical protein
MPVELTCPLAVQLQFAPGKIIPCAIMKSNLRSSRGCAAGVISKNNFTKKHRLTKE